MKCYTSVRCTSRLRHNCLDDHRLPLTSAALMKNGRYVKIYMKIRFFGSLSLITITVGAGLAK